MEWRDYVISEMDYSTTPVARALGVKHKDARIFMVADKRWKLVHFEGGFPPMLFDLRSDPDEFTDLGSDPSFAPKVQEMYRHLGDWARRLSQRTAISDTELDEKLNHSVMRKGIFIGVFGKDEVDPELLRKAGGRAKGVFGRDGA